MNGDFETIEQLGVGAFGVVCLCRQRGSDQLIARKEIRLAALDQLEVSQLREEVKVLEKFRDFPHRNLVEGKGYLHMDDTLCIYMEHCERGSLAADIQRRQEEKRFYDETTVLDYTQQIASGLDHMHRHLVIHRDLRPANVLVTRDGVIKLADFGLGALLSSESSVRNTIVGTPLYTAPEIINAEKYNFSCDIWSFGTVLYELMALQPAFMAPNLAAVMKKVLSGNFSPLEVSYCQPLKVLVQLMLVVDSSKRPDSSGIGEILKFLTARKIDSSSMGEFKTLLRTIATEREEAQEREKRRRQHEADEKKRIEEEERKRRGEAERQRKKEEELRQREADVEDKLRQLRVREADEKKRIEEDGKRRGAAADRLHSKEGVLKGREGTAQKRRQEEGHVRRDRKAHSACVAVLEKIQRKQGDENDEGKGSKKDEVKRRHSAEERKGTTRATPVARHVAHVGFGCSSVEVDPRVFELLRRVGVPKKVMNDPEIRKAIYKLIDEHGGVDAAIQQTKQERKGTCNYQSFLLAVQRSISAPPPSLAGTKPCSQESDRPPAPPLRKESLHPTRSEPRAETKGTSLKRPVPAASTPKHLGPQRPPSSVPSAERKNKSNFCLCLWW